MMIDLLIIFVAGFAMLHSGWYLLNQMRIALGESVMAIGGLLMAGSALVFFGWPVGVVIFTYWWP